MMDDVQETLWQPMVGLWTKVAEFLPNIAGRCSCLSRVRAASCRIVRVRMRNWCAGMIAETTELSLSATKMRLYRVIDRLEELAADILGEGWENEQ